MIDESVITAAGVSAGFDMALWLAGQLAGETTAQGIQLLIEYDPRPPFDSGSRAKASPTTLAWAYRRLQQMNEERGAPGGGEIAAPALDAVGG